MINNIKCCAKIDEDDISFRGGATGIREPFVCRARKSEDCGAVRTETELTWINQSMSLAVVKDDPGDDLLQDFAGNNSNGDGSIDNNIGPGALGLEDGCDIRHLPRIRNFTGLER